MKNQTLDKFGEALMHQVRDRTIAQWNHILDGSMKGRTAELVRSELAKNNSDTINALKNCIPRIVDSTLHHVLWSLEQEQSITLAVENKEGGCDNLCEVSDSLSGELYGNNGWISRFSREHHEEV